MESNAIMILNEYDKDLKYELVQQIGPVHSPCFTVKLVVNGQVSNSTVSSIILQVAQLWQRDCSKLDTFSINIHLYRKNHKIASLGHPGIPLVILILGASLAI